MQVERYHLHVLKTVREAKNAALYVLFNKQKHEKGTYSEVDSYSSLLSDVNALKLIQNFAKAFKITLKVTKMGEWVPDKPGSYLLKKAIHQLT